MGVAPIVRDLWKSYRWNMLRRFQGCWKADVLTGSLVLGCLLLPPQQVETTGARQVMDRTKVMHMNYKLFSLKSLRHLKTDYPLIDRHYYDDYELNLYSLLKGSKRGKRQGMVGCG